MKILISGGAGFVGSNLAKCFRSAVSDSQITVLDNLRRRGSELNIPAFKRLGVRFVHGDVRNEADFQQLREDFDLFVEASAEPSVLAGTEGFPDYVVDTNLTGAFHCLNFARRHAEIFVFLSTSRVYSIEPLRRLRLKDSPTRLDIDSAETRAGVSVDGVAEDFPTGSARSFYGATKLASEHLVQEFVHSYGLKALIYRCSVLCGPGQFGKVDQGVFALWLIHHYFQRPLQYTGFGGTGKQVRDLLHPGDLAELILHHVPTAGDQSGAAFNVGGGRSQSISLMELTDLCRQVTGRKTEISSTPATNPVDVPWFITDSRRIETLLGWRPSRGLDCIFREMLSWIVDNEPQLRSLFF